MKRMWKIRSVDVPDLWWSNAEGWVDEESADWFVDRERNDLNLPVGGQWEELSAEAIQIVVLNASFKDLLASGWIEEE